MTTATHTATTIAELYDQMREGADLVRYYTADYRLIRNISQIDGSSYYIWTSHNEQIMDGTAGVIPAPAAAQPPATSTVTKRVTRDPETGDFHAYVVIDDESEQYLGSRPERDQASRLCDEYAHSYYEDRHTPEKAARIAVETFGPMVICPHCGDEHDAWSHCPGVCVICGQDHATSDGTCIAAAPATEVDGGDVEAVAPIEPTTYRKRDQAIIVLETENSAWVTVLSDHSSSFRAGKQIRRSTLRQMGYFRDEIASSQDVAMTTAAEPSPSEPEPSGQSSLMTALYLDGQDTIEPEPSEPATRYVSVGWDGKYHPDLACIAAQVLLPLAHLAPRLNKDGTYLLVGTGEEIAAPPSDHAIVCDLIDALNAVARQLPAQPDSIYATLHIGGEMYQVTHNGPPRVKMEPPADNTPPLMWNGTEWMPGENMPEVAWDGAEWAPIRARVNWSESPASRLIPCDELRQLYETDPATYRARLAALDDAALELQARLYAIYHTAILGKRPVTLEETLTRFRRSIAIHRAETAPDICAVLSELALTDPVALAELLRSHTDEQRDRLAWLYAAWLRQHQGIVREPAHIAACWHALLVAFSASGMPPQADVAAGRDFVRRWWREHGACVRELAQIDIGKRRRMAENYIAYLHTHGATDLCPDQVLAVWQREIDRLS